MDESHKDIYELVCKNKFDDIIRRQDEMLGLLRGKNDNPGLVDKVRWLERVYKALVGAVCFVLGVFTVQAVAWLFEKLK